jgi:uncharacterized repeat protein (TIGR03843 family)
MAAGSPPPDLLVDGEVRIKGRLPDSSNATLLVELALGDETALAVYKPLRGERPLWDFPRGLYRREIAAYELSRALGWELVPRTVAREGPLGPGSIQQFVHADFEQHYFTLVEGAAHREALRAICAFDLLANNADRKSGHCLLGPEGRVWAIDNGLCFHAEPKLRTVIWDFGGEPLGAPLIAALRRFLARPLPGGVAEWLEPDEQEALRARAEALLRAARFPEPRGGRSYPWPLV